MHCRNFVAKLGLAVFLVGFSAQGAVTLLDKDDWKFLVSGFGELDMITDSTRSGFNEVAGSSPIAKPGTIAGDNGRTEFSARNSRIAFTALPPLAGDWKTKGYLEFDLLGADNGTKEASVFTSPSLRMRHAYLSAEANGFTIISGQYWTLFGWQMAYLVPTVSVPPVTGVLYERTPQVTIMKTVGDLTGALSVIRPVQRDSELPGLEGGLRYVFNDRKGGFVNGPTNDEVAQAMSVAVTGTLRDFAVPQAGSSSTKSHEEGYAVAIDAMIPILASSDGKDVSNNLVLVGEYTTGQGYGDEFPGWAGTPGYGVNTGAAAANAFAPTSINLDPGLGGFDGTGAFQLVNLQTFNAALQYHLPADFHTFVNAGYAQLQSSNASSLGGSYYRNDIFFGNVYHDFTKNVRAAVEYAYMRNKYSDGTEPHNSRIQLTTWFRF